MEKSSLGKKGIFSALSVFLLFNFKGLRLAAACPARDGSGLKSTSANM